MNYGLQLAASGALTNLYRMDVLANNLANVNTVAFKPDIPAIKQREPERIEKGLGAGASNRLLERLGGGVFAAANRIQFTQGTLSQSSNPLDTGIQGEGFFVSRDDSAGRDGLRLTRDGRMTLDHQARLVSATTGQPMLDASGQVITLRPDASIAIEGNGAIKQAGEVVAQLQLVSPSDPTRLTKVGDGLFRLPAGVSVRPATGQIQQHTTEGSAVDPVAALMAINDAAKSAEGDYALINNHDRLLDRAINGLGRTA